MIKTYNISFYRLLSTGYISEETYRAVMPKKKLCELSFSDCYQYEGRCRQELVKLFLDSQVMYSVGFMEKLETDIISNNNVPFDILDSCLSEYGASLTYLINTLIGRRAFLLDYVYCTKEALVSHNFVNKDNYLSILKLVKQYRVAYQNHFQDLYNTFDMSITDSELVENINTFFSSKPEKKEEIIESGEGFTLKETIYIDDDAFSSANEEDRKYVLFLYSLNKDKLKPIIDYFKSLLSNVSVRTLNGISALGFRNFLVNYLYADNTKLLNIRNLGKKSLNDFNKIKPKLLEYIQCLYVNYDTSIVDNVIKKENQIKINENKTLKEQLGDNKYSIITKELEKLLERLSVRSRNGIKAYKGDFVEDFVNKNNEIKNINNIGRKSESEITLVIKDLKEFIAKIKEREFSEEELDIIEKQSYYKDYFDEDVHTFYLKNGHLPLFYMLDRFFYSILEINRNFQIFNLRTPIFKDTESKSLEEIADECNLTRERVRQIHMKCRKLLCEVENEFKDKGEFSFAKFVNSNDWGYVIDDFHANNYIDISMLNNYCAQENHHFTDDFVFFIIGAVGRNDFLPIGKPILPYPTRSSYKWNNCYLVKRKLADKFDFMRLFELIEDYEDSNTEDIDVSAREMIIDTFLPAWIDYDSNVVEEVSDVVSNLLIQELGIIPDEQFRFIIEGKKEKCVADIIYDILNSYGNPMSCDELFQSIDNIYPNKYKSPTSIKGFVERDPRLCFVSGTNHIALIEWEHVKFGSIRNIIVQYLEEFDEPQQAKDIVAYVQRFRDTSDNSIRATMGSGDQFVQFSGGYYGLSWKKYHEIFYLDESDRSFYKRIQELEQFLQAHNHFPFASSNSEEQDLHEWWIHVKSYLKLSQYQKSEVKRIETKYKNFARKKKHLLWFDNCRRYLEFVQEHHRRPSKSILHEKDLCVWLQKASEDFSNGTLTYQQESCYLDLCKSL